MSFYLLFLSWFFQSQTLDYGSHVIVCDHMHVSTCHSPHSLVSAHIRLWKYIWSQYLKSSPQEVLWASETSVRQTDWSVQYVHIKFLLKFDYTHRFFNISGMKLNILTLLCYCPRFPLQHHNEVCFNSSETETWCPSSRLKYKLFNCSLRLETHTHPSTVVYTLLYTLLHTLLHTLLYTII